jgi:hypothetical protein
MQAKFMILSNLSPCLSMNLPVQRPIQPPSRSGKGVRGIGVLGAYRRYVANEPFRDKLWFFGVFRSDAT